MIDAPNIFCHPLLVRQDRFLLPDDCAQVLDELAKMEETRAAAGVTTGASSEKSQSWVHLHMGIAEKRVLHAIQNSFRHSSFRSFRK